MSDPTKLNLLAPESRRLMTQLALGAKPVTLARLMEYQPSAQQESLFRMAYLDSSSAEQDIKDVTSKVDSYQPDECVIFPPLFVRYNGYVWDKDKDKLPLSDHLIPIVVALGGEIHLGNKRRPDAILHFKSRSQSVILSICTMPKSPADLQYKNMAILVDTLYSMTEDQPLSVEQFQKQYDSIRLGVLKKVKK